MKKRLSLSIIFLCCLIVSCGNANLSKDDAEKSIQDTISKKPPVTEVIWLDYLTLSKEKPAQTISDIPMGLRGKKDIYPKERILFKNGYLTGIKQIHLEGPKPYWAVYGVEMSEDLKTHVLTEETRTHNMLNGFKDWHKGRITKLNLGAMKLISVDSITEPVDYKGKKICEVNFTGKIEPNSIGKILISQEELNKQYKLKIPFVKYTDGWKLQEKL